MQVAKRRQHERHRVALSPSMSRVYRGEDDLSEWDEEELQRGKRRVGGQFRGPDPTVLPRAIVEELNRRTFQQAYSIVRDDVEDAVRLWGQIVRDPDADPHLRFEASKEIANRILGRTAERVQVEAAMQRDPWQDVLLAALGGESVEVIDAEVIEEDDVVWEPPSADH
jgi:hypothetical protein